MRIKQTSLLAHGQFVSVFGDTLFDVALQYWILELTGSTVAVASIQSISIITRIISSFFSGSIIDSLNRKFLIIICDIIRGCIILLLAGLLKIGINHFYMYVITMIIIDSTSSFFKPAINSSVVDLIENESYDQVNAKLNNSSFIADLLGNFSISLFFQYCSIPFLFFLDGISYLYSAFTEFFLKIPNNHNTNKEQKNFFKDQLIPGYKFVLAQSSLKIFILFCCLINIFISMANILYLPYFKSVEHLNMKGYSLSMMAFTLGMVIKSFFIEKKILKLNNKMFWLVISSLILSVAISLIIFSDKLLFVICIFFVSGFFNSIRQIIIVSALQANLDQNHKGITFSFYSLALNTVKPISFMIGGVLAKSINISYIIAFVYLISILVVIIFSRISKFRYFISKT